jgi:hypothetical protein
VGMKKIFSVFVVLMVFCGVFLVAQEHLDFYGNYEDVKKLPPQTPQKEMFTFVRLIYNGRIPGYLKNWYTDYPTGDQNLIAILRRTIRFDIAPQSRAITIENRDLFNYPMVYSAEAGQMILNTREAAIMREYLTRGGFWMVDDFWGSLEWENFETQMKKVFPNRKMQDIPQSHPIFHVFYDIEERMQVPNIGYAYGSGIPTWEQDGFHPMVRGIFDDKGRLMVFINHNTDLMDASEWADDPLYPERFSEYAYKIFSNAVVHSLTH